ncbi:MAG: alpha/beta fold hydrolase [Candidatus Nitrosocosmicus sp.]
MTAYSFDQKNNNIINFRDAFIKLLSSTSLFNEKLSDTFIQANIESIKNAFQGNNITKDIPELEKILRQRTNQIFNERFRDKDIVSSISNIISSYSYLSKVSGYGQVYQNFSNMLAAWNNNYIEPIRDNFWRTPSNKIANLEKFSLFHYDRTIYNNSDSISDSPTVTTPILMVYAFINRHYILDLLPEISIVKNLLKQGFDIYATDWGTPSIYDKDLTIGYFVNNYLDKSVDLIRKRTGCDKISLFGYCWGGDLVLIYAALHPEKVKNIITVAAPGDFSLDDTLLSTWSKKIDVDIVLDAFGNVPSILFNSAIYLRNPVENINKYPYFFEHPHGLETTSEFFATEIWLHDSPPVIGEIYREFIKQGYQQNLLIKNQMIVNGEIVNLKNIDMPFLNITAKNDDLVAPRSSIAINNTIGSKDKSVIEFPSGQVGLIIGQRAHKEVWPKVGDWLKHRS